MTVEPSRTSAPSPQELTRVHTFRDDALGKDDATGVAQRISTGEISATEAVEAAIARLQDVNDVLGAMAFDDFDRARTRAARPSSGAGVFGGVPTATKDNIMVAGMPLTMGSRAMPTTASRVDGAFTRQFLDTGAIPICSTTLPPFGWTATTERAGGEVTRNPWHTAYSSGGSSGGSAALVASGVLPFAHGNDGGGSIRIPAAACGLVGLKATRGRLQGDPTTAALPIDVVTNGVLARSVRDVAQFFASAERSWSNPKLPPIGLVDHGVPRPMRVGLLLDSPVGPPTDEDTRQAVLRTAQLMEEAGHHVVPYDAPVPQYFKRDFEDYWSMLAFSIAHDGRRMYGADFANESLDPLTLGLSRRFARRIAKAPLMLARLAASGAFYERRFGDVDVVLSPVLAHTTPRLGHLGADLPFAEHFEHLANYACFTPLHNATGAPSISLPAGLSSEGLPIGVMFSARKGQERLLLEVAYDVEESAPFARIDGPTG